MFICFENTVVITNSAERSEPRPAMLFGSVRTKITTRNPVCAIPGVLFKFYGDRRYCFPGIQELTAWRCHAPEERRQKTNEEETERIVVSRNKMHARDWSKQRHVECDRIDC